jgi:hypothetical protein
LTKSDGDKDEDEDDEDGFGSPPFDESASSNRRRFQARAAGFPGYHPPTHHALAAPLQLLPPDADAPSGADKWMRVQALISERVSPLDC